MSHNGVFSAAITVVRVSLLRLCGPRVKHENRPVLHISVDRGSRKRFVLAWDEDGEDGKQGELERGMACCGEKIPSPLKFMLNCAPKKRVGGEFSPFKSPPIGEK